MHYKILKLVLGFNERKKIEGPMIVLILIREIGKEIKTKRGIYKEDHL